MDSTKYVGMDVHTEAISVAVRNSAGKVIMESILETKANTILEFLQGLRGNVHVTFEEDTWAAWLYDLLKPHVTKVLVCNPRKNALLKDGNKGDKIDARKLSELLRLTIRESPGRLAGDSATCTSTNLTVGFSHSRFFHQ
jgi:hypothetical protein